MCKHGWQLIEVAYEENMFVGERTSIYLRVLNHENVYVGFSRIVQSNNIRIYPIDLENAHNLYKMKPKANLIHWDSNYNKHHTWVPWGLHEILNIEKHLGLQSLMSIKYITQLKIKRGGATVEMMKVIAHQLRLSTQLKPRRADFIKLIMPHYKKVWKSNH